jgi:tetratricopeptide (TPR) repeat protein
MKAILTFFITAFVSLQLAAQDINAIIKEGDRLEITLHEKAAFEKFKEVLRIQPINMYALNKCSELCSRIGKRELTDKARNEYYEAAKKYASIALKLHPENSEANCVMAIALGRTSLDRSGKEKITAAKEIKKHVDIAVKNDPMNYKAWHVLGRWHYEICSLNFLEKAAVKILFGGVPKASLAESIRAFEKAKSILPGFVLNYYEMAKAYKKNNQKDKAISAINTMLLLANTTEDDEQIKADGRKLLKEWK